MRAQSSIQVFPIVVTIVFVVVGVEVILDMLSAPPLVSLPSIPATCIGFGCDPSYEIAIGLLALTGILLAYNQ